ncbi:transcriptional regulator [Pseudoalteromonas lipolytica SCSIO 04301]|uniref:FMN-binding negative transcriptional regulator n=1 Tax=Pseudoalteromonas lipolytica TaxID=570156 RepID=UPI00044C634D|nr:FMN-binding negative transcriptional regulator [Pseudoalteromonas lipolytica]EWH05090.1 transcriptional regulator [Pseudoalteromonas lipolytica SCSIO 04301]
MHTPSKWKMTPERVSQFIKTYSFALMVDSEFEATHLPLVYKADEGELGTLYGHVSRANRHGKGLDKTRVLVVFSGPHSYISPTWYAEKPAVSTWNYAAVHVQGEVEYLDDENTLACLDELISQYEPSILHDTDLLPADYQAKLLRGIVGIKINVQSIQAKEKLGQHKSAADQQGVVAGLQADTHADAQALLRYMLKHEVGIGS